jgi:DnaJ-class molecular chaperone
MENFYEILGIDTKATKEEIKAAYKKMIQLYHPDKNGDSKSANFASRLINRAYEILLDDEKRRKYDIEHNIIPREAEVKLVYRDRLISQPSDNSEKFLWGLFGAAGAALLIAAFSEND